MITSTTGGAFGLLINSDRPIDGLVPPESSGRVEVELRHGPSGELAARWQLRAGRRVIEQRSSDGGLFLAVDFDDRAGYRIEAPEYGTQYVAPDGGAVLVGDDAPSGWHARRLLFTQSLPTAAVLRGLDVLHASAVVLGSRIVAFSGPSGAGKSTLAAELMDRGANFFTDDVLAVEPTAGGGQAHAGPRVRGVGEEEQVALPVGHDWPTRPVPVERVRLVLIERDALGTEPELVPGPGNVATLLGSAFASHVRPSVRLASHLDLCDRLARADQVLRLRVPRGCPPSATAQAIVDRFVP